MSLFLWKHSGHCQKETTFISSYRQARQAVFFMLVAFFEESLAESRNFINVISSDMWQDALSCQ